MSGNTPLCCLVMYRLRVKPQDIGHIIPPFPLRKGVGGEFS